MRISDWSSDVCSSDLMTNPVTDATFEQDVLKATKPVLVDFWAEWCGPCKALAPHLEELSSEMADQVEVRKINIDENPQTPNSYGVRGIPTLMLFQAGQVAATKIGNVPKTQLLQGVEAVR